MSGDAAAQELLEDLVVDWTAAGVLGPLRELVGAVWRRNLDRFEEDLGDDAQALGMQSSRNVCNLAVRELTGLPGVLARDVQTLEVVYGGRVLHTSKVGSRTRSWDVETIDWVQSEVRLFSADANSRAYAPGDGTQLELFGQPGDPAVLRHLHLAWQGFDDGGIRSWLGFPRLGTPVWFAVTLLDDEPGTSDRVVAGEVRAERADFDDLREPAIELVPRGEDRAARPRGA